MEGLLEGKLDMGELDEADVVVGLESVKLGRVSYRMVQPTVSGGKAADWKAAMSLPFVGMEGAGRIMAAVIDLGVRAGVEVNFVVKCSSWSAVADALPLCQGAGFLPSTINLPPGYSEVTTPGMKAFDRVLVLAWDARRGMLRAQSELWRRVLCDALRF